MQIEMKRVKCQRGYFDKHGDEKGYINDAEERTHGETSHRVPIVSGSFCKKGIGVVEHVLSSCSHRDCRVNAGHRVIHEQGYELCKHEW